MKALSIKQPWAYLIVSGEKNIENRTWNTNFRGRLAIHSSKALDKRAFSFFEYLIGLPVEEDLEYGKIIGYVDLIDVVTESNSTWFDGPYGFVLENPEIIDPVPYKGKLGIWEVDM